MSRVTSDSDEGFQQWEPGLMALFKFQRCSLKNIEAWRRNPRGLKDSRGLSSAG